MEMRKSTIISVTSVKGGSGKTINLLNLAGVYHKMGKKVLIIDLDLYSGDVSAILNANNSKDIYNIFEDITNNNFKSIDNYIVNYNNSIDIIAAPKDPRYASKVNGNLISVILTKSENMYDVILIDTNHVLNVNNLIAFDKSSYILYVINNNSMNLKSMKTMVSIFNNIGKNNYKILLYEATNSIRGFYSELDIKTILKRNVDYTIPNTFFIKNIDKYILNGDILTLNKGYKMNKKVMNIYNSLALSLLEQVKYEK